MDDKKRIAEIRELNSSSSSFPGDITDDIVYHIDDHLGSCNVRLKTNGAEIDKEEYYPFGESSMHTFAFKRYRYCGKEKDEESGLYNFEARYYMPWSCRFTSTDPMANGIPYLSPFAFANNNPIVLTDPSGSQAENNISPGGDGQGPVKPTSIPQEGAAMPEAPSPPVSDSPKQSKPETNATPSKGKAGPMEGWTSTPRYGPEGQIIGYDFHPPNESAPEPIKPAPPIEPKPVPQRAPEPNIIIPPWAKDIPQSRQDPGTIREWKKGFIDKWSESSNFFASIAYSTIDTFWRTLQAFTPFVTNVTHLTGESANTSQDRTRAFVETAANFIPLGEAKITKKVVEEGVYHIVTSNGEYIGQSKNIIERIISHFRKGGKLSGTEIVDAIYHTMPGSTKLEREVYEQYLITKFGGPSKLLNAVNPMGGRMPLYYDMIEKVLAKYNLPR